MVFQVDTEALSSCDVLLAILDGRTIDEGVAFEIGVAYAKGKTCIAFQCDCRRLLPSGNNPMIDRAIEAKFDNVVSIHSWLLSRRSEW
ncbi:nucleoside 2-deoxyribosyltransferase [Anatilimnocola sp. NA78]|uniref:nucleoside 2-deoxyribosyltransferase n=1 Tax=Anatilimnocola sp. NA78 TaxID=3415683 RepID=UPI003CE528E1